MSTELELKFSMSASCLPQVIALLPALGKVQHHEQNDLLNAYFDTAQQWFRQHDMGLRTRLKLGRYEQTIKLAGSQHGAMQLRPEYNQLCAGVVPQLGAFPSEIWPPATDVAHLQSQLIELFRTDFCRQSWQLLCQDGSLIELVFDQGQILANGQSQAISELELELLKGDALQLFRLARQLLQQVPLATGWQSKAARGYRLMTQQRLSLPQAVPDSLMAQVNALQLAEACYRQQQDGAALQYGATVLQALTGVLATEAALAGMSAQAAALAQRLMQGEAVFDLQIYHLLLLSLSEFLYQHN